MKTWLRLAAVVAVLAPSVGCTFYFGGDDDPCEDGGDRAFWGYRNPDSGECINFGGGGGTCGDPAPLAGDAEGAALAQPNWASCPGVCEGLDEASCQAAPGCRAAYVDGCGGGGTGSSDCAPTPRFLECWGVAQTGPIQGACEGLDAQGCSEHDDCVAIYYPAGFDGFSPTMAFGYCAPEPTNGGGCYSDAECGAGFECTADTECLPPPGCDPNDPTMGCPAVCYGRCVPSTSTCDAVDCGLGSHCEEVCSGGGGPMPAGDAAGAPCLDENGDGQCDQCLDTNGDGVCDPQCFPVCVPDTTGCEAIDCGPGFVCDLQCFPCDPLPDGTGCPPGPVCEPFCRPIDPPTCGGIACPTGSHCQEECLPCDTMQPGCMETCRATCVPDQPISCAAVTCAPGTHCEETCFPCDAPPGADCAAFCDVACVPDAGPVCETIADEMTCIGTLGCTPVYWGDDCTCDASGVCQCTTTEFARCETGGWWDPSTGTGGGGTSGGQPRVVPRPR